MKYRFVISPSDLVTSNVLPLREYIASIKTDWPSLLGCLVVDDGATALATTAPNQATSYWRAALYTMSWLPYLFDPTQPCIGELVKSQVPDADAAQWTGDDGDALHRSLAILAGWNRGITMIGLIAGVDSAALVGHMDALRENITHATAAPAATRRIQ